MIDHFKKIEDTPYWWWCPTDETIAQLLNQIPFLFDKVKKFVEHPTNTDFVRGFMEIHRIDYLIECNRGEKTGTQTKEETEKVIKRLHQQQHHHHNTLERNEKKTENLFKALIFAEELYCCVKNYKIDINLTKKINKIIGDELFSSAGQFRKKDAKPVGFDFLYVKHEEIEQKLIKLFNEINEKTKRQNGDWYQIASKFLVEFLRIHPFSNGNGRTARILLSILLKNFTIIPVPLLSPKYCNNDVYLDCIQEAQWYNNFSLLNSLIIESTYHYLYNFINILDI